MAGGAPSRCASLTVTEGCLHLAPLSRQLGSRACPCNGLNYAKSKWCTLAMAATIPKAEMWRMPLRGGSCAIAQLACADPTAAAASCLQMACTTKELREILHIAGPNLHVAPEVLQPSPEEQVEMAAVRMKRRLHETLSKAAAQTNPRQAILHVTRL